MRFLYQQLATLGDKRGPVLFQLPPQLTKDLPRLAEFLTLLPADHRAAFEFRNDIWFDDEVYAALKSAGASLCFSEREDGQPPALVETAPWGYVRLRLENYSDADLKQWAQRLGKTGWRDIFCYFMHEPTAPGYAQAAQGRSATRVGGVACVATPALIDTTEKSRFVPANAAGKGPRVFITALPVPERVRTPNESGKSGVLAKAIEMSVQKSGLSGACTPPKSVKPGEVPEPLATRM